MQSLLGRCQPGLYRKLRFEWKSIYQSFERRLTCIASIRSGCLQTLDVLGWLEDKRHFLCRQRYIFFFKLWTHLATERKSIYSMNSFFSIFIGFGIRSWNNDPCVGWKYDKFNGYQSVWSFHSKWNKCLRKIEQMLVHLCRCSRQIDRLLMSRWYDNVCERWMFVPWIAATANK